MKASELKKGMVIDVDGASIHVTELQVQTASSRSGNTLYKIKGRNVATRQKFQAAFKGDDPINSVDFERRAAQYLYQDADGYTFMDNESYEQFSFTEDAMEDDRLYLTDGLEGVHVLMVDGAHIGVELPTTVVHNIVECAPAMKAASSSARTKPATTQTGLVIQVPEYLETGEAIKINTLTGEFMSRA